MAAHAPLVLLAVSGQGIALLVLSISGLGLEQVEAGLVLRRLVEDVLDEVPEVEGVEGLHWLDGDARGAGCRWRRCQLSGLGGHDDSGINAAVAGSLQGAPIIKQLTDITNQIL